MNKISHKFGTMILKTVLKTKELKNKYMLQKMKLLNI